MKLRQVVENCMKLVATNDQYFEAIAVGDVEELLELQLALCGLR